MWSVESVRRGYGEYRVMLIEVEYKSLMPEWFGG